MLEGLAPKLGLGLLQRQNGRVRLLNRIMVESSHEKFVVNDSAEVYQEAEQWDIDGNLRSVREAKRQADIVLSHLHSHECQPGRTYKPAKFVQKYARACIDAGADIFVQQGAHRGVGGVEIYKNKAIIYDPGDFIKMSDTTTRLPIDFYLNEQYAEYGDNLADWNASPSDAFDARAKAGLWKELKPKIIGSVVAVCVFGEKKELREMRFYAVTHSTGRSQGGRPMLAGNDHGKRIIEHLQHMSAPYGTKISYRDGVGYLTP